MAKGVTVDLASGAHSSSREFGSEVVSEEPRDSSLPLQRLQKVLLFSSPLCHLPVQCPLPVSP